ncbi:glycoside hydrolase family 13 protein [Candidatus Bipolaricaulota bacterium]|nr:glycoside hydrolase family 13 protein [Candidatus Bipolaricaulota bacterium]
MPEGRRRLTSFDDSSVQNIRPPEWVRDAVFYQIFPERFYNGNRDNDPENVEDWGEKPTRNNFFGGDLAGVKSKLDYLEELGITAIYLNPIFNSPSNHKYDTTDYYEVDPRFGDTELLKSLVESAHDRDMKVVLDGVFNHSGEHFFAFEDIKKNGSDSKYWNWYEVDNFPIEDEPEPNYRCWAGVSSMPEFDRTNPEVREFLLEVVQHWIKEADIDGWRLDTVNYLEPGFVRAVRSAAKEIKPGAYVMGEVVGPASSWFKSAALDGVMNYELYRFLMDFIARDQYGAREFSQRIYFLRRSYPNWANFSNYNLLSSHDRPRFMTVCEGDVARFKLGYFFLFTFPGAPAIYYGDEIGMEGRDDPDCRRTYPWKEDLYRKDLREYFKDLIKLRSKLAPLRNGNFREISSNEQVFVYSRGSGNDTLLAAINSSREPGEIELSPEKLPRIAEPESLFGESSIETTEDKLSLKLPEFGYTLLKLPY